MVKQFKIILFGLVLSISIFGSLVPFASATETVEQDLERRKLFTLKECLSNDHIDEGDEVEDFNDFWDGGGDHYTREYIVVGFDRDSSNGVQSCKEVLDAGIRVFDVNTTDPASYFVKKMSGRDDLANRLKYEPKIKEEDLKRNRDNWVREIDAKINALGLPKKAFNALRLNGLLRTCYDMRDYTSDFVLNDKDVVTTHRGKQYIYDFKDDLDDDSLSYIDQGDGGRPGGIAPVGRYNTIGDIELGFVDASGSSIGSWDAFNSDFYPFGGDQQSFTSGHRSNNSILNCQFIHDKLKSGYFSDDIVLEVRPGEDVLMIDTNGNGVLDESEKAQGTPIDSGDGAGDTGTKEDGCEFNANPLSWIVCPILTAMRETIKALDNQIRNLLYTNLVDFEVNSQYYQSWSIFRFIALSIIVVAAIIMIIGQAVAGVFDAYSFKKLLPKLVVAVILIALSWVGTTLLIDITNTFALNLRSIFYLPFGGREAIEASVFNLSNVSQGATTIGIIAGGTAVAGLGIMGVLSFVVTGLLAVLVALVILAFRQVLIILLVITAPVAIACSILPNTEKVWKLWKETFTKVLIMFPLIMMLIAAGHLLAATAVKNQGGNDIINQFIAFVGYFGPYFAIPATFKLAGNAFATIAGMANNRSKGLFDRQRAFRERYGKQRQQIKQQRSLSRLGDERKRSDGVRAGLGGMINRQRGRMAFGVPVSGGVKADSKARYAALSAQAAQKSADEEIEQRVAVLDQETRLMTPGDAGKAYRKAYKKAYDAGDLIGMQAAMKKMAQFKDVEGVAEAQLKAIRDGRSGQWAAMVGRNFGDFSEMAPGLTKVKVDDIKVAYADASDETLSKIKVDGWKHFTSVDPTGAAAAARRVAANDKLKTNLTGDVKRFMSDTSGTFNPGNPFAKVQQRNAAGHVVLDPITGQPVEVESGSGWGIIF